MLFERIVSEGLAHYSYIIGDEGKAAVIDPRRDCDIYLAISAIHTTSMSGNFLGISMKSRQINPFLSIATPASKRALQQVSLHRTTSRE